MLIRIDAPNHFVAVSDDEPTVGRVYHLDDAVEGTEAQNRAFHALVAEYWRSGCHSYNAKNFDDFRNQIKRALGAGFEAFIYVDPADPKRIIDAKTLAEIPHSVPRELIRGRLKSWSDYSKKERTETIDRLIAEMDEVGVHSRKYQDIRAGMDGAYA